MKIDPTSYKTDYLFLYFHNSAENTSLFFKSLYENNIKKRVSKKEFLKQGKCYSDEHVAHLQYLLKDSLRKNSLIHFYTLYESYFIEILRLFFVNDNNHLLEDFLSTEKHNNSFEKIISFLKKSTINYNYKLNDQYAFFNDFRKIRNNVVHSRGMIKSESDKNILRIFAKYKGEISCHQISGTIVIEDKFIYRIMTTFPKMVDKLFESLWNYKYRQTI